LPASVNREAFNKAMKTGMLVYSEETMAEWVEVFTRSKFDKYISLEDRLNVIAVFETRAQLINITEQIIACRDPKDDKFLSLAVTANASCIITGDKDLLVLNPFQSIPIVTPAGFLQLF
jgi:putative PIN family toxin of toxin-antitoxin system